MRPKGICPNIGTLFWDLIGVLHGRYERGAAKPTIEVASKIARILGVSLDYLVGNTDMELDKTVIDRVVEIQSLPDEDKSPILYTLDNCYKTLVPKRLSQNKKPCIPERLLCSSLTELTSAPGSTPGMAS
ncbi:hypothetical protein C900_01456 [Fulvivirga imtechensis AK7]|uniref:HTH cro/C1-type domain-containing protein n=1 Tax=Fulvivirga imtechensis AK7 TaxID=1237149 RepID=L8JIA9_9BACT|nr:helix-turn-helix transcriptional regulator [Fulvivirga imtechensis]ELR67983.1 hypothetical protein C900_01456 [Fulvivirga imtechensis AK7]